MLFRFGLGNLHLWIHSLNFILQLSYVLHPEKQEKTSARISRRIENVIYRGYSKKNSKQIWTDQRPITEARMMVTLLGPFSKTCILVNERILKCFYILIAGLGTQGEIKIARLRSQTNELKNLLKKHYPWKCYSPTVHKLIFHTPEIAKHFGGLIGIFSEEAQEARNKDFKYDRKNFSRRTGRSASNKDILRMMIIFSDTYISFWRRFVDKSRHIFHPEVEGLF